MATMFLIASVCCAVLVLAAGALWWSMQRTPAEEESLVTPTPLVYRSATLRKEPHPRLDLAVGMVGVAQNVSRRRSSETPETAAAEPTHRSVQPAAQRQRTAPIIRNKRERLDLAYYNEDMGDLSDPDLNRVRRAGNFAAPESR